jgi:DNA polymerase
MLDARKPLTELHREWQGCMRCPLGPKREDSGGRQAYGEGRTGGIMWIGEGPGSNEAEQGRPFVGASGNVLRKSLNKLGLAECSYISNVVICRSFGPKHDNGGQPMTRFDRRTGRRLPIFQDEAPPTAAVNTCLSRLYEEIYLVDPILIVALGGEAAKAILRRPVKVTEKRGTTTSVNVPGVWNTPDRTGKGNWLRKQGGVINYPTSQNYVHYLMFITLHPAFVLRSQADQSFGNPTQVFIKDMHFINDIYFRHLKEAYGIDSVRRHNLVPNDIFED